MLAISPGAGTTSREVLVTWPDYDLNAQGLGGALAAAGLDIRLDPKRGRRRPEEMREIIGDVVGAIVSTDPFDAELLAACPSLRVIARVGIGVDSIDLAAATRCGVAVTVTPGANEDTVADHTLALMLAAVRRICEHDASVRSGAWNRTGLHTPWTLSGSTVGIVGYGRIGRLVEQRLRGFDVDVLVNDPAQPADDPRAVGLEELLTESDVVSLHVPLVPATRHLIGAREIALMRRDAILVNTARGGVVDEPALLAALEAGRIRGAALDVFEDEPPPSPRLFDLPSLVLSPHNGGLSVESIEEMTRRATASVLDVLAGRAPKHLANPEVLGAAGPGQLAIAGGQDG
ncbi:MAG: phosphoglycerate dehydrogenase [Solirubrobacterales bacterium]